MTNSIRKEKLVDRYIKNLSKTLGWYYPNLKVTVCDVEHGKAKYINSEEGHLETLVINRAYYIKRALDEYKSAVVSISVRFA